MVLNTPILCSSNREIGRSHIYPNDVRARAKNAAALFSPAVKGYWQEALAYDPSLFDLDVPVLGLCYAPTDGKAFWGEVASGEAREYGMAK